MMTNPKVIQEFFHKNLPDHVRESIDFSSIQLQKESHIDDKLKSQISDLLYKMDFNGKPGFLYLLIEHASKTHPLLPFRLLKYMTGIMEDHIRTTKSRELPLVYPLVLYTGKMPYTYTLDFFDLFPENEREIAKQTFFSPYHLIDLTQKSDEELRNYLWYGTMARVLKHIHDADILPFFKSIMEALKFLEAQGEESYIKIIMTYMAKLGETPHQEDLYKIAMELDIVEENKFMTLVEYIREKFSEDILQQGVQQGLEQGVQQGLEQGVQQGLEQGVQQGLEQGVQQGLEKGFAEGAEKSKTEIARNMLSMGMDLGVISSATGLSNQEIKRLTH
jgi:predicted transposase/invertase (TIGR01784 family)